MTTLPFNDRASYIAWRQQWKNDYAAISQEIRDVKLWRYWNARLATVNASLHYNNPKKLEAFLPDNLRERVIAIRNAHKMANGYFWPEGDILHLKAKATEMLAQRKLSKQESQAQYVAQKALVAKS